MLAFGENFRLADNKNMIEGLKLKLHTLPKKN